MSKNTAHAQVNMKRVAAATVVGTTVEWYDFFLYASAAAVIFQELFFSPAGEEFAQIVSFFTVGISFVFRPIGGFLAGHLGDKIGRKPLLVITLIMMGAATTLIGCLPTYNSVGLLAPCLLIFLRIMQGLSAGGEWGGAAMMAIEHAPANKRGFYGSMPQLGVPLGLVLSNAMLAFMQTVLSDEQWLAWGWRIPFLISCVLVFIGYWVRRAVDESPVFSEIKEREEQTKAPVARLFRYFFPLVILSALVFAGNSSAGYMTTGGFVQSYASSTLEMNTNTVLWTVSAAGLCWGFFSVLAGAVTDKIGARSTYAIGFVVQAITVCTLFPIINAANVPMLFLGLALLTIGTGFTYGPQAAFYGELFPASVRFSGVSISYALGALLGGAFSPMIAQWILEITGSTTSISIYLAVFALIGLLATLSLRNRRGIDLSIDNDKNQRKGLYIWQKPTSLDKD